jgi:hypothetical protein
MDGQSSILALLPGVWDIVLSLSLCNKYIMLLTS